MFSGDRRRQAKHLEVGMELNLRVVQRPPVKAFCRRPAERSLRTKHQRTTKAKSPAAQDRNISGGGLRSRKKAAPWALTGLDRGPRRKSVPQASSTMAHERKVVIGKQRLDSL
jgi:hypothetical protein